LLHRQAPGAKKITCAIAVIRVLHGLLCIYHHPHHHRSYIVFFFIQSLQKLVVGLQKRRSE
jgi:hypothetical protein